MCCYMHACFTVHAKSYDMMILWCFFGFFFIIIILVFAVIIILIREDIAS
jgi:hypothetical protein